MCCRCCHRGVLEGGRVGKLGGTIVHFTMGPAFLFNIPTYYKVVPQSGPQLQLGTVRAGLCCRPTWAKGQQLFSLLGKPHACKESRILSNVVNSCATPSCTPHMDHNHSSKQERLSAGWSRDNGKGSHFWDSSLQCPDNPLYRCQPGRPRIHEQHLLA